MLTSIVRTLCTSAIENKRHRTLSLAISILFRKSRSRTQLSFGEFIPVVSALQTALSAVKGKQT